MRTVIDCFSAGAITVLVLNDFPPAGWKRSVRIREKEYETEMVYDIPTL